MIERIKQDIKNNQLSIENKLTNITSIDKEMRIYKAKY